MPDVPEPTSLSLTKNFYVHADDIAINVLKSLKMNYKNVKKDLTQSEPGHIPDKYFKGPF